MSRILIEGLHALTYANVTDTLKELDALLKCQNSPICTIDLSLIEFIDSAGVALLVELRKMAQKRYTISINLKVSSVIKKMLQFYDVKNLLEVGNEC